MSKADIEYLRKAVIETWHPGAMAASLAQNGQIIVPPNTYAEADAAVRAVLRALRQREGWMIGTEEGAEIMARRKGAYVAACGQIMEDDCRGKRIATLGPGSCAACADLGDHVSEAFIEGLMDASE